MNNNILYWYIISLINSIGLFNCSALSRIVPKISHDQFTRLLRKQLNIQITLWQFIESFHEISKGYIIIDDSWIPKCLSNIFQLVKIVYSGKFKRKMPGITVVLLLWTDGNVRIPLSLKIWEKGGKTKPELAYEMLSNIRNHKKLKPEYVLFDAHYATKQILKLLDGYGWRYICNIPKNRHVGGKAVKHQIMGGYGSFIGTAWYGGKVKVFRRKSKFYLTNRLGMNYEELRNFYKYRVIIEEVFRILKQECGIIGCQMRCNLAYENHFHLVLINFICLEHRRIQLLNQGEIISIYKIRQSLYFRKRIFIPPLLKKISKVA